MAKSKSKKTKIITGINPAELSKARPTRIPRSHVPPLLGQDHLSVRKMAVHFCLLAAFIALVYGNSLFGQFVFNDDYINNVIATSVAGEQFWLGLLLRLIATP